MLKNVLFISLVAFFSFFIYHQPEFFFFLFPYVIVVLLALPLEMFQNLNEANYLGKGILQFYRLTAPGVCRKRNQAWPMFNHARARVKAIKSTIFRYEIMFRKLRLHPAFFFFVVILKSI